MKRVIYIVPGASEEWLNAIKVLLEKLEVTYSDDDAKKFCSTPCGDQIVVTYHDESIDALLDNMDKCDYINNVALDEKAAYKELKSRALSSQEDIDVWIDKIYASMPTLLIDKDLSKAANALLYYPTWVNLQH